MSQYDYFILNANFPIMFALFMGLTGFLLFGVTTKQWIPSALFGCMSGIIWYLIAIIL